MKLANRHAFITGGGRGIGRAIALAFAREGASVALLLASEDGRGISGQAINVDGGTVLF